MLDYKTVNDSTVLDVRTPWFLSRIFIFCGHQLPASIWSNQNGYKTSENSMSNVRLHDPVPHPSESHWDTNPHSEWIIWDITCKQAGCPVCPWITTSLWYKLNIMPSCLEELHKATKRHKTRRRGRIVKKTAMWFATTCKPYNFQGSYSGWPLWASLHVCLLSVMNGCSGSKENPDRMDHSLTSPASVSRQLFVNTTSFHAKKTGWTNLRCTKSQLYGS